MAKRRSRTPSVLIVDDDLDNREMYSVFLARMGFRVEAAADAEGGLDKAAAFTPDVVLMDLGLPGVDGWEAARRLKNDPATRGIAVVALSGHVVHEARVRALDAGVDGFIAKPTTPSDMHDQLRRILARLGKPFR